MIKARVAIRKPGATRLSRAQLSLLVLLALVGLNAPTAFAGQSVSGTLSIRFIGAVSQAPQEAKRGAKPQKLGRLVAPVLRNDGPPSDLITSDADILPVITWVRWPQRFNEALAAYFERFVAFDARGPPVSL